MKLCKWIALLLVLSIGLGLCACREQGEPEPDMEVAYTFERSIRPVGMHALFGVINLNSDMQYVSQGKQSLCLTPMGSYAEQLYAYFPFRSDTLSINFTDLNYISAVQVDVYAPENMVLGIGFYFSNVAELKTEAKQFTLKQGWNTLTVPVQHSLIALQYDLVDCYGIYVQFEEAAAENSLSVYLDNIQIHKRTEPVQLENSIILDEWDGYCELADFEHAYQQILVTSYTSYNKAKLASTKVVKASDYGLEAPSGEKVLRVETYPCLEDYGATNSWNQLFFSDAWLDAMDIGRFQEEADSYELKFSVYQEGEHNTLLELNLYHAYDMDWGGVTTVPGQWVEYCAPLSNFTDFLRAPSQFAFAWLDWDPALADSKVFYIDNIRIEKAG